MEFLARRLGRVALESALNVGVSPADGGEGLGIGRCPARGRVVGGVRGRGGRRAYLRSMKTLLALIATAGLTLASAQAKDVSIPVTELPKAVTDAISAKHPNSQLLLGGEGHDDEGVKVSITR